MGELPEKPSGGAKGWLHMLRDLVDDGELFFKFEDGKLTTAAKGIPALLVAFGILAWILFRAS